MPHSAEPIVHAAAGDSGDAVALYWVSDEPLLKVSCGVACMIGYMCMFGQGMSSIYGSIDTTPSLANPPTQPQTSTWACAPTPRSSPPPSSAARS